ncbi:MAG: extracellular solute-binding protein [Oscillospiraceae bacterium]|nr:extracellular solute-binding protein [Oscillospiraceae bacterium]
MSIFKVNLTAINPKEENRCTMPVEVLVDTGSELSWLPRQPLLDAGIIPRGKKRFNTATNQVVERDFGYAILTVEGYTTNDEIVFAEDGDMWLLGVRTLEGFGVMVDNIGRRFVATTSLVVPLIKNLKTIKQKFFSLAVILTALILICLPAVLTGCGGSENPGGLTEPGEESGPNPYPETEPEPEPDYLEMLPAEDFGGYTFKIIAQHFDARPNFPAEEETGEPMNDSLLLRNRRLEARLGINIENIAFEDRGQVRDNVNRSVRAQDAAYDMVITSMADGINTLAPSGALHNLNSLDHLRLEEVWWSKTMYENMQVDGKIFYTTGPLSPFFYYTPVVFVYNKNKAADFDIGDMNKLVLNNEWTADKLAELKKDKNTDLDGDGVFTANDFYGLAHDNGVTGQALFAAFGQKMTVRDDNSYFRLNFEDERAIDIIRQCAQLLSDPATSYNGNMRNFEMYSELPLFIDGKALFLITTMNNIIERFRAMEEDYGIIPLPKLDSSQPDFISLGNPWGPNGIAVPNYCDNPGRTGLIMETMAYLSYEMVRPAMYDIIIQQKIARDEESQQMLDLIYANFYFDLNVIHDFGGSSIFMREAACGLHADFVSGYERIKDRAETALNNLIEAYQALE